MAGGRGYAQKSRSVIVHSEGDGVRISSAVRKFFHRQVNRSSHVRGKGIGAANHRETGLF